MHITTVEKCGYVFLIGIFSMSLLFEHNEHLENVLKIKTCGISK
jgi:hypothetical protein